MLPITSVAAIGRTPMTAALGALGEPAALTGSTSPGRPGAAGVGSNSGADGAGLPSAGQTFVNTLGDALKSLNEQLTRADASMADFASGGSSDLHTVMLEMQEASIGLKVGIQVRDRLLEAYQEVMRLQI